MDNMKLGGTWELDFSLVLWFGANMFSLPLGCDATLSCCHAPVLGCPHAMCVRGAVGSLLQFGLELEPTTFRVV